jgi:hypothetical protein
VRAVVAGQATPERMLSDFKAYATRALRSATGIPQRRRYWTYHGSTRYLWNVGALKAAIDYVIDGQGVKMQCYQVVTDCEQDSPGAYASGSDSRISK